MQHIMKNPADHHSYILSKTAELEELSIEVVWSKINPTRIKNHETELYCILRDLVRRCNMDTTSKCFPVHSDYKCLKMIEDDHSPQVQLLALILLGYLCNGRLGMKVELVKKNIIRTLLKLFEDNVKTHRKSVRLGQKATSQLHLKLMEQSLGFVFFLSLGPRQVVDGLVFDSTVSILTRLLKDSSLIYQFPKEGKTLLQQLVMEEQETPKPLIAKQCSMTEEDTRDANKDLFGEGHSKLKLSRQLAVLDLYDTSTNPKGVQILKEMQDADYVWPGKIPDVLKKPENQWVEVHVMSVVDSATFWALLGGDTELLKVLNITEEIKIALGYSPVHIKSVPACGTWVMGQNTTTMGLRPYRGQVIEAIGKRSVRVLAVDHGDIVECSDFGELFELSPELITQQPPLARLCRLAGAQPKACSLTVIENALGILCNLACQVEATKSHFEHSGTAEKLLFLHCCPKRDLQLKLLRLLSNMARTPCLRVHMAKKGVISALAGDLKKWCKVPPGGELPLDEVEMCLGALGNALYECEASKAIFVAANGLREVLMLTHDSVHLRVRRAALAVLRLFAGPAHIPQSSPTHKSRKSLMQQANSSQSSSSSMAVSKGISIVSQNDMNGARANVTRVMAEVEDDKPISKLTSTQRRRKQRNRNKSKDGSSSNGNSPIILPKFHHSIASQSQSDGSSSPLSSSPSELLMSSNKSGGTEILEANSFFKRDSQTTVFIKDSRFPPIDPRVQELRSNLKVNTIDANNIRCIICSFLNSEKGGSIYFGVDPDTRHIFGMKMTRDDRDSFCIGISRLMNRITPIVMIQLYEIKYHPLNKSPDEPESDPDLLVIEISIRSCPGTIYTMCPKNEIYIRQDGETVRGTYLDLAKKVVEEEEVVYIEEMDYIKEEIARLSK